MIAADGWELIPQPRPKGPTKAAPVKLSLSKVGAATKLTLTVDGPTLEALGWTKGDSLAMEVGRQGKVAGWLRFSLRPDGPVLRPVSRGQHLIAAFHAPLELVGRVEPVIECEHRVLPDTATLLVQLPWGGAA